MVLAPYASPQNRIAGAMSAEVALLTERRLEELDRLRDIGIEMAGKLSAAADALPLAQHYSRLTGRYGYISELDRIIRAVRQIVVLEYELRGIFRAPDRDALPTFKLIDHDRERPDLGDLNDLNDLNDLRDPPERDDLLLRSDYRRGPLDVVVADIRKVLGAEPPADDPFSPPPERRQALPGSVAPAGSSAPLPGERPPSRGSAAKPKIGMKIATPAKPVQPAIQRNGFRVPPTSPHNPNSPARKHRRNRGPPK
jgi:hypothetical protein